MAGQEALCPGPSVCPLRVPRPVRCVRRPLWARPPGSHASLAAPRHAPAPFLTIVGNRPRPWPMRTPSPVRLSDVGASSPSRLLSLWPSEQNVLQASLQRTVPRGSPPTPLPLRVRPAPSSFRGPCRGACGAPPGVRAGVRALCRDGALCGDAAPCPGVSPVLSLIRPLAPGRWPQSSPRPLPGAPAGPAAPS